jgi:hypothetical protein
LPSGLPERTPVFIISAGGGLVSAKDARGNVWRLMASQVDCGWLIGTSGGGWIHESRIKALTFIREQLERHLETPRPEGHEGWLWDETTSEFLWVLERNSRRSQPVEQRLASYSSCPPGVRF